MNTSHRAGQSHHVLGWMEGERAEAATGQRPTRAPRQGSKCGMRVPALGAQAGLRVWDEGTRPGGRSPASWAGFMLPGLGSQQMCRHLVSAGGWAPGALTLQT